MEVKAIRTFFVVAAMALGMLFYAQNAISQFLFELMMPKQEYIERLRESRHSACLSLPLVKPDILFIGDSHGYTGWDFRRVQQELSSLRVGACQLPGLHLVGIVELLRKLEELDYRYDLIVLNTSPHMFSAWDDDKARENSKHLHVIEDIGKVHRYVLVDLSMELATKSAFKAYSRFIDEVETWEEPSLSNYISKHVPAKLYPAVPYPEEIDKICQSLSKIAKATIVSHIPESPILERQYSKEQWVQYERNLTALETCGFRVVKDVSADYHLGNRHFANRQALQRDSKSLFEKKYQDIPSVQMFDYDHLNFAGSRIFTSKWLDRQNLPILLKELEANHK